MQNQSLFATISTAIAVIFALTISMTWGPSTLEARQGADQQSNYSTSKTQDSDSASSESDQVRRENRSTSGESASESARNQESMQDRTTPGHRSESNRGPNQQKGAMILSTSQLVGSTVYTTSVQSDSKTSKSRSSQTGDSPSSESSSQQRSKAEVQELGKVDSLMVDPQSGKVAFAVLARGGFMGIGSKKFAVPLEKLRVDRKNERVVTDVSPSELERAPEFKEEQFAQWDNAGNHSEYIDRLDRHYGFTGSKSADRIKEGTAGPRG